MSPCLSTFPNLGAFCTCWSKAITASYGPVNVKLLIESLIFGKIKKSHGGRSGLNAGWMGHDIVFFAVCSSVGRYVIIKKRNETSDLVGVTCFKTSDFCN
ncbi:hypothetical protein EVAR_12537_1 [Eumeta japonica]|uniref:Uncharacterized protein n=1 Tax=Eumeta variegata TaxID=151549 RepID=A0A4C1TPP7_EUMVA|nr:hypothetical protein EVAR_12537_1 [Eumeta japonica]